jgi:hypothetical protein
MNVITTPQIIVNTAFNTASHVKSPPCAPFKPAPPSDAHMVDPDQDHVSKKLTYEDRDCGSLMFSIYDVVMKN